MLLALNMLFNNSLTASQSPTQLDYGFLNCYTTSLGTRCITNSAFMIEGAEEHLLSDAPVSTQGGKIVSWVSGNDRGTLRGFAKTGAGVSFVSGNAFTRVEAQSRVTLSARLKKVGGVRPPTFAVHPGLLRIVGAMPPGESSASWDIQIRVGTPAQFQPLADPALDAARLAKLLQFHSQVKITGYGTSASGSDTFRIALQEGDLPQLGDVNRQPYTSLTGNVGGCEYRSGTYHGVMDMGAIGDGEEFVVECSLELKADMDDQEAFAEAEMGNPAEYSSGVMLEYDGWGEIFYLEGLERDAVGNVRLPIQLDPDFYYILCRSDRLGEVGVPVSMALGEGGQEYLMDPEPPRVGSAFYSGKKISVDHPMDSDGDGMDDVYELRHVVLMDPLDETDADADPDGDGLDNLEEYLAGTDPGMADNPVNSGLLFGGVTVEGSATEMMDVNGDGIADMVILVVEGISRATSLEVRIRDAKGLISLTNRVELPAPLNQTALGSVPVLIPIQLNGDSRMDLVILNTASNVVGTLRGTLEGTLQLTSSLRSQGSPVSVGAGDLDGDGIPELVVSNEKNNQLEVFTGRMDGTFSSGGIFSLASLRAVGGAVGRLQQLVVGDFDGDKKGDVAVSFATAHIGVMTGNGTGGFVSTQFLSDRVVADKLVAEDMNRDGLSDLIALRRFSSPEVDVMLGKVGGGFEAPLVTRLNGQVTGWGFGDMDGDQWVDAMIFYQNEGYDVLMNQKGGGFGVARRIPGLSGSAWLQQWDGDGHLDLVRATSGSQLVVNRGRGDGSFEGATGSYVERNGAVASGDFSGDGSLDFVVMTTVGVSKATLELWDQNGGWVTNKLRSEAAAPLQPQGMVAFDYNKDQRLDVLVVAAEGETSLRPGTNAVAWYSNTGEGGLVLAGSVSISNRPSSLLATGDFNGDGWTDLMFMNLPLTSWTVLINQSGAGFVVDPAPALPANVFVSQFTVVDTDQDGADELVVVGANGIEVWERGAAGSWTRGRILTIAVGSQVQALIAGDVNGDGRKDLVWVLVHPLTRVTTLWAAESSVAQLAEGHEIQVLAEGNPGLLNRNNSYLEDLNGDGRGDLVLGSTVWLGGSGPMWVKHQNFSMPALYGFTLRDANGDGKLDLVGAGAVGQTISILLQNNPGAP